MEHWYALQTQRHKECFVRDVLEHRGIEAYLPALPLPGKRAAAQRREQPFFARYLFARLDLSRVALSSIAWCQGMTGVVCFGGQPAIVEDGVIRWLKVRLAQIAGGDLYGGLPFVPDTRLRIVAGPLRGMEAIFERRLSSEDRASVLVQLLGRLTTCDIPLGWLAQV